ncbi:SLAM family member 5 isoform X2 [Xiphophorus couchianus]|uniref:SLAM family member 5 isoform X2 n=1 Tax=Xiphophorus couchianus TaxID=32473 RepID=UPI001015DC94|nr:SLAM family member 5-like isoform X2 [Xiphophorus couchianus]
MRFIVLFLLFQGLRVKVLGETGVTTKVEGYVGDTIILPAKVFKTWTLSRIDWSILSNYTWIATWHPGGINTDRRPEYKGRLSLNISTGDLTMRDLRLRDAMTYNVDLLNASNYNIVNRVQLVVKERLKKPTIQLYQNFAKSESGCVLVLNCSSPDTGINFSWEVEPSCHHCSNNSSSDTSELIAFFLTTPDTVNLTCIVKRELENASSILISKIKVPTFRRQQDCGYMFAWGFFTTLLIVIGVILLFHFRGKITEMFQQFRGPVILPATDSNVPAESVTSQK